MLIDDDLKPWLLETNFSPSLNTDQKIDLQVVPGDMSLPPCWCGRQGEERRGEGRWGGTTPHRIVLQMSTAPHRLVRRSSRRPRTASHHTASHDAAPHRTSQIKSPMIAELFNLTGITPRPSSKKEPSLKARNPQSAAQRGLWGVSGACEVPLCACQRSVA